MSHHAPHEHSGAAHHHQDDRSDQDDRQIVAEPAEHILAGRQVPDRVERAFDVGCQPDHRPDQRDYADAGDHAALRFLEGGIGELVDPVQHILMVREFFLQEHLELVFQRKPFGNAENQRHHRHHRKQCIVGERHRPLALVVAAVAARAAVEGTAQLAEPRKLCIGNIVPEYVVVNPG